MADVANVFEKGVDYRDKFIDKYGRKCNIPSALFLDAKFHPTLPDHFIVLSSVSFPSTNNLRVNAMIPAEISENMHNRINDKYLKQAKTAYFKQNRTGTGLHAFSIF